MARPQATWIPPNGRSTIFVACEIPSPAFLIFGFRIIQRNLQLLRASMRDGQSASKVKTPENFQIRPARVEDVPIILQLIRDLATYERAPHEVTATEEQLVDVLFGERPAAEVLLAFEGQSPIGFAVFFHNFSTWLGRPGLYLEDLFVKPEKRGKGYGRALLVELAKIGRNRGCGRMEWAVLDWNEPAIKFYRSLGAKPMDEWTVFRLTRDEIAKLAGGKQLEQE
jgi:GNAT superfamily N-acetyltransferase